MHPVIPYVIAAGLFALGVYGVIVRRNAILLLMSVELMLNGVNLLLVTADTTVRAALPNSGQAFALFIIVLATAEVGVGLAVVLRLYRMRRTIALDEVPLEEPPADAATATDGGTTTAGAATGEPHGAAPLGDAVLVDEVGRGSH